MTLGLELSNDCKTFSVGQKCTRNHYGSRNKNEFNEITLIILKKNLRPRKCISRNMWISDYIPCKIKGKVLKLCKIMILNSIYVVVYCCGHLFSTPCILYMRMGGIRVKPLDMYSWLSGKFDRCLTMDMGHYILYVSTRI